MVFEKLLNIKKAKKKLFEKKFFFGWWFKCFVTLLSPAPYPHTWIWYEELWKQCTVSSYTVYVCSKAKSLEFILDRRYKTMKKMLKWLCRSFKSSQSLRPIRVFSNFFMILLKYRSRKGTVVSMWLSLPLCRLKLNFFFSSSFILCLIQFWKLQYSAQKDRSKTSNFLWASKEQAAQSNSLQILSNRTAGMVRWNRVLKENWQAFSSVKPINSKILSIWFLITNTA